MISSNTNIKDVLSIFIGKFCIATFLLVFLNFTVIIQYVDITSTAFSQVCEEEEEHESEKDFELYKFQFTIDNLVLDTDLGDCNQNVQILMDYHTEVFTPPPEFI